MGTMLAGRTSEQEEQTSSCALPSLSLMSHDGSTQEGANGNSDVEFVESRPSISGEDREGSILKLPAFHWKLRDPDS